MPLGSGRVRGRITDDIVVAILEGSSILCMKYERAGNLVLLRIDLVGSSATVASVVLLMESHSQDCAHAMFGERVLDPSIIR
jgi:hypothetical protein